VGAVLGRRLLSFLRSGENPGIWGGIDKGSWVNPLREKQQAFSRMAIAEFTGKSNYSKGGGKMDVEHGVKPIG